MPDGSILYEPRRDNAIRPAIETPIFVYALDIVDKTNGYHLFKEFRTVDLTGFGKGLALWKLDRSSEGKKPVYILTKPRKPNDNRWDLRPVGLEIVHAHVDGFFPFRDALYPADLSLQRVAAMMDRYDEEKDPKDWPYLDNRLAYAAQSLAAQAERDLSPFRPANFEFDPMAEGSAAIYFPAPNSARSVPRSGTATAADGSMLSSGNKGFTTWLDRNGRVPDIMAEWAESGGRNKWMVYMMPLRTHIDGYGETRAVVVLRLTRPALRGTATASEAAGLPPSGSALADLINFSAPIAGPHVGHMVVIVSKMERDPDPFLKVESYRPVRHPGT